MIRKRKARRGQIAILLALSFSIIFLLIAMVINISFLVTAKINLQNSVDLAAYAGAAQQARYLTEIGKWNYEMRRNYKAMVFDYMIALNSERTPDDFKKYINNAPSGIVTPFACASLQREKGETNISPSTGRKITCQLIDTVNFQKPIETAERYLGQVGDAADQIFSGEPGSTVVNAVLNALISADEMLESSKELAKIYAEELENYKDMKYNYNLRLLNWLIHDYRHLQTRIRGVHFGGIKIKDRWDLTKRDLKPVIFNNSPMSVAAKVINGYTDLDSPPPTDSRSLNLMKNNVIKNPAHNAARKTFENNLIKVIHRGARLFHLKPVTPTAGGDKMNEGCRGECNEFNGPYLKLKEHDVKFLVWYFIITKKNPDAATYDRGAPRLAPVTNFPVGVAKDARIMTYYTLVGVADTKNIPFNVFFGSGEYSQSPPLVAIAAARPFGSRIGPYINEKCENLYETPNIANCILNGSDPLYPYQKDVTLPANFSVLEPPDKDIKRLGVKITVSLQEYGKAATFPSQFPNYTELYAKTDGKYSRWRYYTQAGDKTRDDGLHKLVTDDGATDLKFFDNKSNPRHPMGNRNSVVAWHTDPIDPKAPIIAERDNYEGYLKINYGQAIHRFEQIAERETKDVAAGSGPYFIYTFKYPKPTGNEWDIDELTTNKKGPKNRMEKAFAGTMAVNEFEIKRYILPHRSITLGIPYNVLNWSSTKLPGGGTALSFNPKAMVYSGAKKRDAPQGGDNKPFDNYANYEPTITTGGVQGDALDRDRNRFPESYTSWRIGSRGYRVKIVNIQDLRKGTFNNKLSQIYNITYETEEGDKKITVDLDKIHY